jgi:hypothetical protein
MGTQPEVYEMSLQTLRRREPLLDAWLEATNRLGPQQPRHDGSEIGSEGRPPVQSSDRVIVHPEPMWQ